MKKTTQHTCIAAAFAVLPGLGLCEPAAHTLRDPIPGKILQSDIVVEAVEFVRAPRTVDSSPLGANEA